MFLVDKYKIDVPNVWDGKIPLCHELMQYVYVFYNQSTGLYKIGITNMPRDRKRRLETQSGCFIDTVLLICLQVEYDESAEFVESYLHKHFAEYRHHGEWFRLSIKQLIQIRNLFYHIYGDDFYDYLREHYSLLKQTT
jgi:hypothetical protein